MGALSWVWPGAVAAIPVLPTATPVTVKLAVLVPCGTVMELGAVAIFGSTPERVTSSPLAGAISLIVTETVTDLPTPGAMGFGANVSD